jgi:nucleoside-diphosphate-sugar epimerase
MSHPGRLRRHRGMRIAIVGGTGTLGGHVATELSSRGHEVRVLSRSAPEYRVDLLTGAGLETALEGCDVVVDASNNAGRKAAAVLVEGTRRLLAAEQAAGVSHHVCVSIVGCDQVPMGYYRDTGPEVTELRTLARTWRSVTGRRLTLIPIRVPGRVGRALRSGALTTSQAKVTGHVPFAAWVEAEAGMAGTARGKPGPG